MKLVAVAASIVFLSVAAFPQKMTDLDKLVETERAFARMAAEKSTKEAFLHFLADDGIVFEKGPVNGKEVWSKRPESKGLLSWEPVWADISADGSIGYTTGPWEFRSEGKGGEPAAFGQYVTIWKKQKNGEFRAVLDLGISHGKTEGKTPELQFAAMAGRAEAVPGELLGPGENILDWLGPETRLYRDNESPIVGDNVAMLLRSEKNELENGAVCRGLTDFRYCYGRRYRSFQHDNRVPGSFLQIHRFHSGKWEIALDLFTESPEE